MDFAYSYPSGTLAKSAVFGKAYNKTKFLCHISLFVKKGK